MKDDSVNIINKDIKDDESTTNSELKDITNIQAANNLDTNHLNSDNTKLNKNLEIVDVKLLKIPMQEGKLWIKKNEVVLNVCFKNKDFCK